MDTIDSWRRRIAVLAFVLFVLAVVMAVAAFEYEVTPYDQARADIVGPVENLLIFSGPLLGALARAALVVRRVLPRLADEKPVRRTGAVTSLVVSLLLGGAFCFAVLSALLIASYAIVACNTQGC